MGTASRLIALGYASFLATALMSAAGTAQESENCEADEITVTRSPDQVVLPKARDFHPIPETTVNFTLEGDKGSQCILVRFSVSFPNNVRDTLVDVRALLDGKVASNQVRWKASGFSGSYSHEFLFLDLEPGKHTITIEYQLIRFVFIATRDRITTVYHN